MWVSRYFVYFIIYSCMGWVYEIIYTLVRERRWENRGFLNGPICPIYGIGALTITGLSDFLEARGMWPLGWQQIFLISFLGSIVLEYITSWGLEKLFHASWWDYSEAPLNIHGRVCLPASLGFGAAGVFVAYLLIPFVKDITSGISPVGFEGLGILFAGVLGMDLTLTISALTNFEKMAVQLNEVVNRHMEAFVKKLEEKKLSEGDLLTEERERFTKEKIKKLLQYHSIRQHEVLRRVKKYRYPEIDAGRMEHVLKEIKGALKRK